MNIVIKFALGFVFFGIFGVVPSAEGWECDVTISGPSAVKKDQTVTLTASGTPSGGSYSWSRIPKLEPSGDSADLTAFEPTFSEYIRVLVTYTTPRGKKCSAAKYLWYESCCIEIDGPGRVDSGDTISLSASAEPEGGQFSWENSDPEVIHLEAFENKAALTGLSAGTATITLTYDCPETDSQRQATHLVKVTEACQINLTGTSAASVGSYDYIFAETKPEGGTLTWEPHSNIESINDNNIHHGAQTPGIYSYKATYVLPDETSCESTFEVAFVKVRSVSGPFCVNSGATLFKSDFSVRTIPEEYDLLVNISPLTYTTEHPYSDETVTASVGLGTLDDAVTDITVVNSRKKVNLGVEVSIPNYISEPLKTLGLSEKLDLKINSDFNRFWECCSTYVSPSVEGTTTVKLEAAAGPFTIAGIPMPKKIKEYITVDILNAELSCGGNVKIEGNYQGCLDSTDWSGGGKLLSDVKIGAEAKAKNLSIFVIKGKLRGQTGLTQAIKAKADKLLISSKWEGLDIIGIVEFQYNLIEFAQKIEYPLINKKEMPQTSITLPSLKTK